MIYFDFNATSPLLPEAGAAWIEANERFFGNPSSPHRLGSRAETAMDDARDLLARILGCDPLDIVWTSGATESNNTLIHHLRKTISPPSSILVSSIEHPSVIAPVRQYFNKDCQWIPVNRDGVIELQWVKESLDKGGIGLVAVMAANNETGVLQPWAEISKLCQETGVPYFCDAVQWLGKLPARGLGDCSFLTGCAHKFGGPRGIGFLKCPPSGRMTPLLCGGPQEGGRRAGTENLPAILAMVAALEVQERWLQTEAPQKQVQVREEFESHLKQNLPGIEIIGEKTPRLWNTVAAVMPEIQAPQRWVVKLDKMGFAVSTGSACASGKEEPSHVLRAIGISSDRASRVLRFSGGWQTRQEEWAALLKAIRKINSGTPEESKKGSPQECAEGLEPIS